MNDEGAIWSWQAVREDLAHIVVRQSVTRGQATVSVAQQEEQCRAKAQQLGLVVHDVSIDRTTSAFRIPPLKRKQLRKGLDRAAEYGTLIYYRQSRLCRRVFPDFADIIAWAKANKVKLVSVTEAGDPLTRDGQLAALVTGWNDENDSATKSKVQSDNRITLAADIGESGLGRWPGGRPAFGQRPVCRCHERETCPDLKACTGWELRIHEGNAKILIDAATSIVAGKSVNFVISQMNAAGVLSADGKAWSAQTLRNILRRTGTIDIIGAGLWADVQDVIGKKPDAYNKGTRTATDSMMLDLAFCGDCIDAGRPKGKLYRWHRPHTDLYYARCRNEMKRGEQLASNRCLFSVTLPYEWLEQEAERKILEFGDHMIQVRITDDTATAASLRIEEIGGELVTLAAEHAAKRITRAEFMSRQMALMDEQDELEKPQSAAALDSRWRDSGETVRQRWERLSTPERRLWLLRAGVRFTVRETHLEPPFGRHYLTFEVLEEADQRERIVMVPEYA